MKLITPRAIRQDELAVLEAAISRAPVSSTSSATLQNLRSLSIIGVCECGCRTVYFLPIGRGDTRIADGLGRTPSGKSVDVMVWASGNYISALDIVDHESSGALPMAESITAFGVQPLPADIESKLARDFPR